MPPPAGFRRVRNLAAQLCVLRATGAGIGGEEVAVWQYAMHLVPRAALEAMSPPAHAPLSMDQLESLGWSGSAPSPEGLNRLAAVLPERTCWASTARQFGDAESHCVQVFYEAEALESVYGRIDARALHGTVVAAFVEFAESCDGVWLGQATGGWTAVQPGVTGLRERVLGSPAVDFVADAEGFLRSLRR